MAIMRGDIRGLFENAHNRLNFGGDYFPPEKLEISDNDMGKNNELKYTPKVGDKIKITKSETNWHPDMDKWDQKIVTINSVTTRDRYIIMFAGGEKWTWDYSHKHFEPFVETPDEPEEDEDDEYWDPYEYDDEDEEGFDESSYEIY